NPQGGTLTLNGHTYTWQNFEELSLLFLTLIRINGYGVPFAVFCAAEGGLNVYRTQGNAGVLALHVTAQALSNALEFAQANNALVRIATGESLTLFALSSGELQVNATDGSDFTFSYQTRCGELPASQPIQVVEAPVETLTIINRPR